MIGCAPEYMNSKYYDVKKRCLKPGAPEKYKRAFEDDHNNEILEEDRRESYPQFKHPYLAWNGEMIEKP